MSKSFKTQSPIDRNLERTLILCNWKTHRKNAQKNDEDVGETGPTQISKNWRPGNPRSARDPRENPSIFISSNFISRVPRPVPQIQRRLFNGSVPSSLKKKGRGFLPFVLFPSRRVAPQIPCLKMFKNRFILSQLVLVPITNFSLNWSVNSVIVVSPAVSADVR